MAAAANAALQLTISGPTGLDVGEVATYTVSYSGAAILGADVDIVTSFGTIGGGVIITPNRDVPLDFAGINPASGNYEVAIINDIAATDLGSPLFSFTLTYPPYGYLATISLVENAFIDLDWNQIMGTTMPSIRLYLNDVPEPMTIGLLGIGGLFLRRRK